ncbi:MAG TPA: hypothetical protein VNT81_02010, partial [Vicinamibacterales bacterium]|nr:hypothetical protein [Vicinamibacterales bacterium]
NGEYGRVYGVPAARRDDDGQPRVDYTPIGGYPLIGFMSRFGAMTVWHSGSGVAYPELADRLRPYNPTVAIVAIGPQHFSESEAADLAESLDLQWLVPAPVSPQDRERFLAHVLGHRPAVRFKLFEAGETWSVPE